MRRGARSSSSDTARKRRRSASASRSPRRRSPYSSKKGTGRPENKDAIIPFKDFLLRQADDVTPEEAQKAYNRYKRETAARSAKQFFEKHSNEDWMKERYDHLHPCMVNKRERAARDKVRKRNLEVFQKLRTEDKVMFPYFENTSPLGALIIPGLPATTPRAALTDVANSLLGLCHLTLGTPNDQQAFSRTIYFLFTDKTKASAALSGADWAALGLKDPPKLPDQPLNLIRAPRPFSVNNRGERDTHQCRTLIEALDAKHGLSHNLFQDSAPLPLMLAYLREVHLYDYYRCALYESVDQMVEKSTTLDAEWDDDYDLRNWDSKVDMAYEKLIAQAKKEPPPDDVPWAAQLNSLTNAFHEENIQRKSDTKYKCMQCGKLFLGPQFVMKHLQSKHQAMLDALKVKACVGLYFDNYMADENRPYDPVPVSKNARPPDNSRRRRDPTKDKRSRDRSERRDKDRSEKDSSRKRDSEPDEKSKEDKKAGDGTPGKKEKERTDTKESAADEDDRKRKDDRNRSRENDREKDRSDGAKDKDSDRDRDSSRRKFWENDRGGSRKAPPRRRSPPAPEGKDAPKRSIVSYSEVVYADPDKPTPEEEALNSIGSNSSKSKGEAVELDYGFGAFDLGATLPS